MAKKNHVLFLFIIAILNFYSACAHREKKTKSPPEISFDTLESMIQISPNIATADLVIFDIDHTIYEAKTLYCHSNWFYEHYEEAIAHGIEKKKILDVILPRWEQAQKHCEVKAVEPFVPDLIREIQGTGKKVMALTSRSENIKAETIAQLNSLGIDFSSSAPSKNNFVMQLDRKNIAIENGVVFTTDYLAKGDVIKEYFKQIGFNAKNIVFIDDSTQNLHSVAQVLSKDGIGVKSFHYPLVKRTMPAWDKKLADIEWEKRHGKVVF